MNDRFTFRLWEKEEKQMYGPGCDVVLDLTGILRNKHRYDYYANRFIIMQSTGLKDKNGVLIFEGDIVRLPITPTGLCQMNTPHEVYFYEAGAEFTTRTHNGVHPFIALTTSQTSEIEIIGNIHENPELLEQ